MTHPVTEMVWLAASEGRLFRRPPSLGYSVKRLSGPFSILNLNFSTWPLLKRLPRHLAFPAAVVAAAAVAAVAAVGTCTVGEPFCG